MLKEANEVLALGQSIADALRSAKADGHTDWHDVPKFAPVVARARAAISGSTKISDELETATAEDLLELSQQAMEVAIALIAAILTK